MKKNWWLFVAAAGVISVIAYASGSASWVHILMGDPVWPLNCPGCSWHKSFHYEVTLEQPWTVSSVVWSSDGKYLAVGSAGGGIINVYDTANWQLIDGIWRWDIGGFEPLTRFTDQNTTLIFPRLWGMNAKIRTPGSMADENVSIEKWNIRNDTVIKKYYARLPEEDKQTSDWRRISSIARAVAVSVDGSLVGGAIQGGGNPRVLIYDATSTQILQSIPCAPFNTPEALAFSPDAQNIAVGGCNLHEVSVYDTKTGILKYQKTIDPEGQIYSAISYSPDGSLIAVASSGGQHGIVTILQAANGTILGVMPNTSPPPYSMSGELANITNLQWIDNNLVMASYDFWNPDGSIARIWDVRLLKLVGGFRGNHLNIVAVSPDGSRLAAVFGKNVVVGDLR